MAKPSKLDLDKVQKCYYCDKVIESFDDLVIKKFPMATSAGIRQYNRKLHMNCLIKYNEEVKDVELKKEENSAWDLVYRYFRKELLELDETTPLQQHEIKRLLGLRLGTYYPSGTNTRILPRGYSFETILVTMKVIKPKIRGYLTTGNFANHKHRVDGILRFIAGEINDVQKRLDAQVKSNEKLKKDVIVDEFDYYADLKRKEENTSNGIKSLFGGLE